MRAKIAVAGLIVALASGAAQAQPATGYAYGADMGWVTQEERQGFTFRDATGHRNDPFALLKNLGVNAIRLRVWVDPKDGWNTKADTLAKAKRAAAQGQRIMIDFHYSDDWADPQKQVKPKAWVNDTEAQLEQHVSDHTTEVLSYLKANGIDVSWVQVGNEITNGLLWPDGDTQHWAHLTALTNRGYDAVKAVYPDAQVVIHIDNGWNDAKAKWWFDNFFANSGKVDIIGLSYYPAYSPTKDWKQENPHLGQTMTDLVTLYHKPVMVVEIGFSADKPHEAKLMIGDVIARNKALNALSQDGKGGGDMGLGVFYWEPDSPGPMNYPLGAMTDDGRFTAAMDAFKH